MRKKLPFLFFVVGILFLLASLVFLSGVVQTILSWNWLLAAGYRPLPVYTIIENVFFFLGFLVAAVALVLRRQWATRLGQTVTIMAAAWFWVDRVLIAQNKATFARLILPLLCTVFLLILIVLSLSLLQPYMNIPPLPRSAAEDSGANDGHTPA